MPVRVALDDGMDLDAWSCQGAEDGRVARERIQVDLDPGRPRKRREAGGREAVLDGQAVQAGDSRSVEGLLRVEGSLTWRARRRRER